VNRSVINDSQNLARKPGIVYRLAYYFDKMEAAASASEGKASRRSINLKEKLEIINEISKGAKQYAVAETRNLATQTVNRIWKCREEVLALAADGKLSKKKRLREPEYPLLDQALSTWVRVFDNNDDDVVMLDEPQPASKADVLEALSVVIHHCMSNGIDTTPLTKVECELISNCGKAVIQSRVTDHFSTNSV
jgi:hypothetical protein